MVQREYGLQVLDKEITPDFAQYAAIVLAVAHDQFKHFDFILNSQQVIYDIKSILERADGTL